MSTGSTKSNRNKQPKPLTNSRARIETAGPVDVGAAELSYRSWLLTSIGVMLVGAILRLYDLPLVPFHHDEGVNGNFLVRLVRDGFYHYDPENYHGPTLYYFAAVIPWVIRFLFGPLAQNAYGLTTFNTRLVPALFGLGTIWLVLSLHRRLGRIGSLAAATLLAVSPGAVYLSRYFIHESLFVFFTFGIVVAGLKYYEDGHPVYLVLAAASAALLFATKETWIISVAVLLIALVLTHVYRWLWRALGPEPKGSRRRNESAGEPSPGLKDIRDRLGGSRNIAIWAVLAVGVFAAVGMLFYSSFLTNWTGVWDSLKTFQIWSKTGQTAHVHPFWTYLVKWLPFQESPLLVLGTLGAALVFWRPKNSFALFSALWAFGIISAYSLVPYKTPWLMLNFLVPLALSAGYAIDWLYQRLRKQEITRTVVFLILVACLLISGGLPNLALASFQKQPNWMAAIPGYQTIDLNFFNYDNDDEYYVYVYAHSHRDLLTLVNDVDQIAKRSGTGFETGITIVSPDYWPLPWYFRDYKRVGYFGHVSASNEPIIIASEAQREEVQTTFGDRYRQVNSKLKLRPGVELLLFVRKDMPAP
ncbi:MAG: hypothetical protein JWM21_3999 [Acidobacteria bacterium]|nr:hypothetical protein [Acidobacteriota bacterium]